MLSLMMFSTSADFRSGAPLRFDGATHRHRPLRLLPAALNDLMLSLGCVLGIAFAFVLVPAVASEKAAHLQASDATSVHAADDDHSATRSGVWNPSGAAPTKAPATVAGL